MHPRKKFLSFRNHGLHGGRFGDPKARINVDGVIAVYTGHACGGASACPQIPQSIKVSAAAQALMPQVWHTYFTRSEPVLGVGTTTVDDTG